MQICRWVIAVSLVLVGCGRAASSDALSPEASVAPKIDAGWGPCIESDFLPTPGLAVLEDSAGVASVVTSGPACRRTFTFDTTAQRRDDLPARPRSVTEHRSSISTGNLMFDGLYQIALADAEEDSVAEIQNDGFNHGAAVACPPAGCFETGRLWTYVWTRDTAYAADLGLGWVDPARAAASLDFKLSLRRNGSDLQIVQDTGTGGSYPVSTDRAIWALGARKILMFLTGEARRAFRDRAFEAIVNTAAQDRYVAFDPRDGLYRGEQSFLDWREQSYPSWTVPDVANIASSKALSTNVAQLILLETGQALALETGDARAAVFGAEADALRTAIRATFWLPDDQRYSAYLTTALDPAPARRFDLLGTSLAILAGIATPEQGRAALGLYPIFPYGAPVIFPEQQQTPIYHNRAIWPFVTAYALLAAKKVGNDAAFDAHLRSLMRASALYLTNVENLELVSGTTLLQDGAYTGPVVSSQRQLWSVAGYLAMVISGLFGVEPVDAGLQIAPFVPKSTRREVFPGSNTLVLSDLEFRGAEITVVVHLPPAIAGDGAYKVERITIDGLELGGNVISIENRDGGAGRMVVDVELSEPADAAQTVASIVDVSDYRVLFGPRIPSITSVDAVAGLLAVNVDRAAEAAEEITIDVYRDGARVAHDLPGSTTRWIDVARADGPSHCYTIDATYPTGTVSHRARPVCWWGPGNDRVVAIPASQFVVRGGQSVTAFGRFFFEAWGDPGDTIQARFVATRSGIHLVHTVYGNGAGPVGTGITCAVKRLVITRDDGVVVADGPLVMPQRGAWDSWGESTFVRAPMDAGRSYDLAISSDLRTVNMSAFSHFEDYSGGTGGPGGAYNRVNIAEVDVRSLAN